MFSLISSILDTYLRFYVCICRKKVAAILFCDGIEVDGNWIFNENLSWLKNCNENSNIQVGMDPIRPFTSPVLALMSWNLLSKFYELFLVTCDCQTANFDKLKKNLHI